MDLGGIRASDRAYLLKHPTAPLAAGHGRLWAVDTAVVSEHRPPVGAHVPPPTDTDPSPDPVRVARLVPLSRRSRRYAGNTLRGWGVVWLVALACGGWIWADDPDWVAFAAALCLVMMIVPGSVLTASARRDTVTLLPLEVARDRVDRDGLHTLEVRDVDGSTVSLVATAPLATALLLSSDPDADPLMPLTMTADTLSLTAADRARPRDEAELLAAPALVNPAFPAEFYAPDAVETLVHRAAQVAGVSDDAVRARAAAQVEPTDGDVLDLNEDIDGSLDLHTRSWAAQSCVAVAAAPFVVAAAASILAATLTLPWAS
ncbi:hypothetical protein [Demequina sp. NBRC 110057]|uniref:hypothetical protein n=1 Tax=Demequina sp. NBRC 110057 TaxID=1570346 RepID=UPI001177B571|nr:hypothetical protein [Demequina sp. NBRC 110057]